MSHASFTLPSTWPKPYDAASAERLIERIGEIGPEMAALAARPDVAALLRSLGGGSPFLSDLAVREAGALAELVSAGPDQVLARTLAALRAMSPAAPRARIASAMRQAKRVVALIAAIADIGGIWSLEQVTAALSDLAEAALALAAAHLLRAAYDAGELRLPDPEAPAEGTGFIVLGMGKLGARELNYSSDIDLVLIHDPDAGIYTARTDGDARQSFMSRLGRALVGLMETRDADGYVFRTDLRLRPDPGVTPSVISLPAAITYYESMGQNWERAAMIKARPVAGDRAAGTAFLEAIRPFVWRRGLDFAAMADIHAIKDRMDRRNASGLLDQAANPARLGGYDVKLGEGGIREIEFLAQTLQLVWGGRDPGLRDPTTLGALRVLARSRHLAPEAAATLSDAYRFLRRVEHRLQMVADRQTHVLPERQPEFERVACFLGFADAASFASAMLGQIRGVRARYADIFGTVPASGRPRPGAALVFDGDDPAPSGTVAALRELRFADPAHVIASVRGWKGGRLRALRSERARELLGALLPAILAALARQPHPDTAFSRLDEMLSRLPAGVQLLSLFQRNPGLLDRIAAVLGAAPPLADHLARYPAALDGLLSPDLGETPSDLLRIRLRDARRLEDVVALARRAVREEDFAISVATLEGRMDANEAGLRRSALADAALAALLPAVLDDFAERYGRVPEGAMAVVLLGKAGGREMMAGSDLDLMLIYDHPAEASESQGGKRSLLAPQWFVRAAHAFVGALTTPGAEGPFYAVDMRLRPSGNKGPVAVSLSAFRRYHQEAAWTWERMALTRARVAAGPPALRQSVEAAIATALDAGNPAQTRADAAAMRARMWRDLPPDGPWDVKLRAGGQVEVEFIAQVLQLLHPCEPTLRDPTTRVALANFAEKSLLAPDDAALLIRADHLWRTVQGMLRLTLGRAHLDALPEASARPLLRATGATTIAALRAELDATAAAVRDAFRRLVGEIKE
ncbi:MAG TPA: bifunctional [glutamine synthetase] adenylyltransferase/[glutamine synthetase]-adenylyl-L-tyrosine phosphorylase [Acetobacteraceae bacterium]|nr:bifunctional [glutamine synthetase] adenylyltransferase/[glutamine synthetase]-adenylyl-L-tyrosine phosphorylase [Acetobacteraceae bacterium]